MIGQAQPGTSPLLPATQQNQLGVRKEEKQIKSPEHEAAPALTPHAKINSTCIKDLNSRAKTTKLLEENTRQKFHSTGFASDFIDMMLRAQATTTKQTNRTS